MELYASGLNAWGQLQFQATESQAELHDLHEFTRVLTGDAIDRPRPSLSHTSGRLLVLQTKFYSPTDCHRRVVVLQAHQAALGNFGRVVLPWPERILVQ